MTRAQSVQTPQLEHVWHHDDGGLLWDGRHVSIGLRGSQVFGLPALESPCAMLLSSYDGPIAAPIWARLTPGVQPAMVDSADLADRHAAITRQRIQSAGLDRVRVELYGSSASAPLWTYTYPYLTSGEMAVGISDEGERVVALVPRPGADRFDLLIFDAGDAPPLWIELDLRGNGGPLAAFDLSGDGGAVVFRAGDTVFHYDIADRLLWKLHTDVRNWLEQAVGISGDGRVIAMSTFGSGLKIVRHDNGSYVHTMTYEQPGNGYVSKLDVSHDGSTIAFAYAYPASGRVDVLALDVATGRIVQRDVHESPYLNKPLSVSISRDGGVFAVGELGHGSEKVPEVRLYVAGILGPVHTVNLPGPAHKVDVSGDGQWIVAGSGKHAGFGGAYDLWRLGSWDLSLRTPPCLSQSVLVELTAEPAAQAVLLISDALAPAPIPMGSAGTLYLAPSRMRGVSMGIVPDDGLLRYTLDMSSDPSMLGTMWYVQSMLLGPDRFGRTWLTIQILP